MSGYTVKELAEKWGVSLRKAYKRIKSRGMVPCEMRTLGNHKAFLYEFHDCHEKAHDCHDCHDFHEEHDSHDCHDSTSDSTDSTSDSTKNTEKCKVENAAPAVDGNTAGGDDCQEGREFHDCHENAHNCHENAHDCHERHNERHERHTKCKVENAACHAAAHENPKEPPKKEKWVAEHVYKAGTLSKFIGTYKAPCDDGRNWTFHLNEETGAYEQWDEAELKKWREKRRKAKKGA
jgi:hypothetical protein